MGRVSSASRHRGNVNVRCDYVFMCGVIVAWGFLGNVGIVKGLMCSGVEVLGWMDG